MMISAITTYINYNWSYDLIARFARIGGGAGIAIHLLYYFLLHHDPSDVPALIARMVVVISYIPLLFYPTTSWKNEHKIYLEVMLAVTMPGYFSYLLLLDTSLYFSITLVFISMTYGALSKWQVAVFLYPISIGCAFGLALWLQPEQVAANQKVLEMCLISGISMIVAQLLKSNLDNSHGTMIKLKEKADQQNEIFSALLDISVEVSRFDDLDEIFHLLLKRFETIYPGRGYGLLVEGPRPKIIPYMAFRGVSQKDTTFLLQVHPYVLGFASVGIKNNEETLSSIEGDDWQVFGGGIRTSSIQGQTVYCFKLFIKGRPLDVDERKTLEVFLETIRGMTRSRIQALELERYSNTDQLTNLYNRNYFDRVLDEWQLKARPEKPFSLIFADINGLKRINDTYGHQAGDELLKSCAGLLVQVVRNSDLVFRLGGDEVVILCPSTDLKQVQELVKRIETQVENLIVPCTDEMSGEVTDEQAYISFGAACSTEQGPDETLTLADKRMFVVKENWYEKRKVQRYR